MTKRTLRTIQIDELDSGYKVTTDVRCGYDAVELDREKKVRLELAVSDLAKVMKIVKAYLGTDLDDTNLLAKKNK